VSAPGDRPRDPSGRPRQDRPRDALGRPLPHGSPGVTPEPEVALPPAQALERARELLAQGRPFSAHEVLEARWKDAPDHERDLWQGLAQVCVGLTHAARGNRAGAERLLGRGAGRLQRYADSPGPRYGVDPAALAQWAREAAHGDEPGTLPL
jgi:hypothetical protein